MEKKNSRLQDWLRLPLHCDRDDLLDEKEETDALSRRIESRLNHMLESLKSDESQRDCFDMVKEVLAEYEAKRKVYEENWESNLRALAELQKKSDFLYLREINGKGPKQDVDFMNYDIIPTMVRMTEDQIEEYQDFLLAIKDPIAYVKSGKQVVRRVRFFMPHDLIKLKRDTDELSSRIGKELKDMLEKLKSDESKKSSFHMYTKVLAEYEVRHKAYEENWESNKQLLADYTLSKRKLCFSYERELIYKYSNLFSVTCIRMKEQVKEYFDFLQSIDPKACIRRQSQPKPVEYSLGDGGNLPPMGTEGFEDKFL